MMVRHFVILTNSASAGKGAATAGERDQITGYLQGKKWHVWHWFEDVWMIVTDDVDADISDERLANDTLHEIINEIGRQIVILAMPAAREWISGKVPKSSVPWLKAHWIDE